MTAAEELKENLKKMGKLNVFVQTFWATVVDVDWANKTATVKDNIAELEVYDVLLGLGQDNIKPVGGTRCLCGIIENKDAAAFIIHAEEIEERWINGNGFGGLTK